MPKNNSRITTTSNKPSNPVLRNLPPTLSSAPTPSPAVTKEQIAKRAYEKFVARGGARGDHERDWLEAEKELQTEARRRR